MSSNRAAPKAYRRIATEEAYAIPELFELYAGLAKSNWRNLDIGLFPMLLRPQNPLGGNLLDLDDQRLRDMDAAGVDMQVLALSSPGVQVFDADTATAMAEMANDALHSAIQRHPTRYAGLGAFAPQDPRRAVLEMERAVKVLGLNGFILNSHTDGEYLDHKKFWPILEAAEALDRPIYIHPRAPSDAMAEPYRLGVLWGPVWGYQAEVSIHVMRMILARVFDHFPKLKVVIGHMGENIPFYLWRADHWYRPKDKTRFSDVFKRNVVITTSGAVSHEVADEALKFCIRAIGADNIMWAADYPWQEIAPGAEWMNGLDIDPEDKAKIFHRNAERIFHIKPLPDA
jgi:predicted TIM-barrel fold metal-dependent hydrolase